VPSTVFVRFSILANIPLFPTLVFSTPFPFYPILSPFFQESPLSFLRTSPPSSKNSSAYNYCDNDHHRSCRTIHHSKLQEHPLRNCCTNCPSSPIRYPSLLLKRARTCRCLNVLVHPCSTLTSYLITVRAIQVFIIIALVFHVSACMLNLQTVHPVTSVSGQSPISRV
jgi:hypothetical protein